MCQHPHALKQMMDGLVLGRGLTWSHPWPMLRGDRVMVMMGLEIKKCVNKEYSVRSFRDRLAANPGV